MDNSDLEISPRKNEDSKNNEEIQEEIEQSPQSPKKPENSDEENLDIEENENKEKTKEETEKIQETNNNEILCTPKKITLEECKNIPECTCGKCIIMRNSNKSLFSTPYNKYISSTYKSDYTAKNNNESNKLPYIRNKECYFSNVYKKYLQSSLITSAQMSFKPYKIKAKKIIKNEEPKIEFPTIVSTTNRREYPDYGRILLTESNSPYEKNNIYENIPLRGKSTNKRDYIFNDESINESLDNKKISNNLKKLMIFGKSNLKFEGEGYYETSNDRIYKSIDLSDKKYYEPVKIINQAKGENSVMESANIPYDYISQYRRDYVKYNNIFPRRRFRLNVDSLNNRYADN